MTLVSIRGFVAYCEYSACGSHFGFQNRDIQPHVCRTWRNMHTHTHPCRGADAVHTGCESAVAEQHVFL